RPTVDSAVEHVWRAPAGPAPRKSIRHGSSETDAFRRSATVPARIAMPSGDSSTGTALRPLVDEKRTRRCFRPLLGSRPLSATVDPVRIVLGVLGLAAMLRFYFS